MQRCRAFCRRAPEAWPSDVLPIPPRCLYSARLRPSVAGILWSLDRLVAGATRSKQGGSGAPGVLAHQVHVDACFQHPRRVHVHHANWQQLSLFTARILGIDGSPLCFPVRRPQLGSRQHGHDSLGGSTGLLHLVSPIATGVKSQAWTRPGSPRLPAASRSTRRRPVAAGVTDEDSADWSIRPSGPQGASGPQDYHKGTAARPSAVGLTVGLTTAELWLWLTMEKSTTEMTHSSSIGMIFCLSSQDGRTSQDWRPDRARRARLPRRA